ncbi:alpha/beta-hydrolase [Basidiobolus meristosporus CBS 931.73]|uniref:Alpha/beta-hydrolase n=1 Tax=Basidiobolus meristosporus CBS 931.73 TaxID=1314790 RepID=A0A1Y1XTS1_9FUNG|nr:alpha/beta-hydrolase [Basidiobolus meristosporus CBS 931.73]|eukprot:ORX89103.1 alpha/beta-hydrolase [Basidiobolus meristosporus CBS 931.73]
MMKLLSALTFCCAAISSLTAAPLAKRDGSEVSAEIKDMLIRHGSYAAASYCLKPRVLKWDCGSRCVGEVKVTSYFEDLLSGLAGYVGVNHKEKTIIVAFRGSSNIRNWVHDLDFLPLDFQYPNTEKGTLVHGGFLKAFNSVSEDVISGLKQVVDQLPSNPDDYELLVTGHSLGGAVAVHGAMEIKNHLLNPKSPRCITPPTKTINPSKILLHTYGQPRVGNQRFAQLAFQTLSNSTLGTNMIRVTSKNDPVPHLPPESFGFQHSPHEVYIHWFTGKTVNCNDGQLTEDNDCIRGYQPVDVISHMTYWDLKFGPWC